MTEQEYDARGNSVFEWVYTADNLVESANILRMESYHWSRVRAGFPSFRSYRITDVVTMLYAMAVECLLKALWLCAGKTLVNHGKYVGVNGNTSHNLVLLAQEVEKTGTTKLDGKDYSTVKALSKNISSGRYPVGKNRNADYEKSFVPGQGLDVVSNGLVQEPVASYEDIKELLTKLYAPTNAHIDTHYPGYLTRTNRWEQVLSSTSQRTTA